MGVGSKFLDYPNGNIRNSLLMFFNHAGDELRYKRIWGDSIVPNTLDNVMGIVKKICDSIYIASGTFGPLSGDNPMGEIVFDTSGHVYNSHSRPGTVGFPNMIKTTDGKFVIASTIWENDMNHTDIYLYKINANLEQDTLYTQNFVYDSLCPDSIVSGDIDMTDCELQVGFEETPTPEEYYAGLDAIPIKAYPNPASEVIRFDYQHTERFKNISLQVYNALGNKVLEESILTGQQGSKVNVSNWSSGIYIAVVSSGGKVLGKVKFVVK